MIQFACPRCQTMLSAPDEQGGAKVSCPRCKQRLQVPQSELNRTMVGKLVPQPGGAKPAGPESAGDKAPASPPPVGNGPSEPVSATTNPQLKIVPWFYTLAGKQLGPVPWAQLRFLTATGEVKPTERVWTKGMTNWALANAVQGLFPAPSAGVRHDRGGRGGTGWMWASIVTGTVACAGIVLLILVLNRPQPEGNPGPVAPPPVTANTTERELSPREIVAKVEKSITLIQSSTSGGTGFVVLPGIIATNAHVVDGVHASDIQIRFPGREEGTKKPIGADAVLLYDRKRDLAFIALKTDAPPLPAARNFKFIKGDKIIAIGSPGTSIGGTMENAVSEGLLSTRAVFQGQNYFQITIAINPGNSGGPVLNTRGEIIGVATLRDPEKQQLGFCIPVEDLEKNIQKVATIGKDKYEKLTSDYNARTIFRRIYRGRLVSLVGLQRIVEAWSKANLAGRGPLPRADLETARDAVLEFYKKSGLVRFFFVTDVKKAMPHIDSDKLLPLETRQRLGSLWASYGILHDLVLQPWEPGTIANYGRTIQDLVKKQDELILNLKNMLGVSEEDLKIN